VAVRVGVVGVDRGGERSDGVDVRLLHVDVELEGVAREIDGHDEQRQRPHPVRLVDERDDGADGNEREDVQERPQVVLPPHVEGAACRPRSATTTLMATVFTR
jgi:hypothetical protein